MTTFGRFGVAAIDALGFQYAGLRRKGDIETEATALASSLGMEWVLEVYR